MPDFNDVVRHVILRIVVDQAGLAEELAAARAKLKGLQDAEKSSNKERVKDADTVTQAIGKQNDALDKNRAAHDASQRSALGNARSTADAHRQATTAITDETKAVEQQTIAEAKAAEIQSRTNSKRLEEGAKRRRYNQETRSIDAKAEFDQASRETREFNDARQRILDQRAARKAANAEWAADLEVIAAKAAKIQADAKVVDEKARNTRMGGQVDRTNKLIESTATVDRKNADAESRRADAARKADDAIASHQEEVGQRIYNRQQTAEENLHHLRTTNADKEYSQAETYAAKLADLQDDLAKKGERRATVSPAQIQADLDRAVSASRVAGSQSDIARNRATQTGSVAQDTEAARVFNLTDRTARAKEREALATAQVVKLEAEAAKISEAREKLARQIDDLEQRAARRTQTTQGYKALVTNAKQLATAFAGGFAADVKDDDRTYSGTRTGNAVSSLSKGFRESESAVTPATSAIKAFFTGFKEADVAVRDLGKVRRGLHDVRVEAENLKGSGGSSGFAGFFNALNADLEKISDGITKQTSKLGKFLFSFRGLIVGIAAAFGPLSAILGSLGAVALGLASDFGSLAGVMVALPGIIGALVSGFGAIALVMKPLTTVISDYTAAQKEATTATTDGSTAAKTAALNLKDAQLTLEQAQLAQTRANQDATRAQVDLNDARVDAARKIQDYRLALQKLKYDEESAQLGVDTSEEAYRRSLADPTASNLDRKVARNAVEGALFDKRDQQVSETRLKQDSAEAEKKGVSGSDEVVSATRNLQDAALNIQAAAIAYQKAQIALKKATLEKAAGGTAAAALQADLDKLPPKTRAVAEAFLALLKGPYKVFRNALSENIFGPLSKDTGSFSTVLGELSSYLLPASQAIGTLADNAIKLLTDPDWKAFFSDQGSENKDILLKLGGAALSVADGFREIITAARPFTREIVDGVGTGAKSFDKFFGSSGKGFTGLQNFLSISFRTIKEFFPILKNFGSGIAGIFDALNDRTGANKGKSFTDRINTGILGISAAFKKFGDEARDPKGGFQTWLRNVGPLIKDVAEFVGRVGKFFGDLFKNPANLSEAEKLLKNIAEKWLPKLSDIFDRLSQSGFISKIAGGIGDILGAFDNFLKSGGATSLSVFADILEAFGKMVDYATKFKPLSDALAVLASVIAGIAGVSLFLKFTKLVDIIKTVFGLSKGLVGLVTDPKGTFNKGVDKLTGRDAGLTTAKQNAKATGAPVNRTGTGGVVPHLSRIEVLLQEILSVLEGGSSSGGSTRKGGTSPTGGSGSTSPKGGPTSPRGGSGGSTGGGSPGTEDEPGTTLRNRDATTASTTTKRRYRRNLVQPLSGLPSIEATGDVSNIVRDRPSSAVIGSALPGYLGGSPDVGSKLRYAEDSGVTDLPVAGRPFTGRGTFRQPKTTYIASGPSSNIRRDGPYTLSNTPDYLLTDAEKTEKTRRNRRFNAVDASRSQTQAGSSVGSRITDSDRRARTTIAEEDARLGPLVSNPARATAGELEQQARRDEATVLADPKNSPAGKTQRRAAVEEARRNRLTPAVEPESTTRGNNLTRSERIDRAAQARGLVPEALEDDRRIDADANRNNRPGAGSTSAASKRRATARDRYDRRNSSLTQAPSKPDLPILASDLDEPGTAITDSNRTSRTLGNDGNVLPEDSALNRSSRRRTTSTVVTTPTVQEPEPVRQTRRSRVSGFVKNLFGGDSGAQPTTGGDYFDDLYRRHGIDPLSATSPVDLDAVRSNLDARPSRSGGEGRGAEVTPEELRRVADRRASPRLGAFEDVAPLTRQERARGVTGADLRDGTRQLPLPESEPETTRGTRQLQAAPTRRQLTTGVTPTQIESSPTRRQLDGAPTRRELTTGITPAQIEGTPSRRELTGSQRRQLTTGITPAQIEGTPSRRALGTSARRQLTTGVIPAQLEPGTEAQRRAARAGGVTSDDLTTNERQVPLPSREQRSPVAAPSSRDVIPMEPLQVGGQYGSRPASMEPVKRGQPGYAEYTDEKRYQDKVAAGKALPREATGPIKRGQPGFAQYSRYLETTNRASDNARSARESGTDEPIRRSGGARSRVQNLRDTGDSGFLDVQAPRSGRFLGIALPGEEAATDRASSRLPRRERSIGRAGRVGRGIKGVGGGLLSAGLGLLGIGGGGGLTGTTGIASTGRDDPDYDAGYNDGLNAALGQGGGLNQLSQGGQQESRRGRRGLSSEEESLGRRGLTAEAEQVAEGAGRRGLLSRGAGLLTRGGGGLARGLAGGLAGAALSGAAELGGDYLTSKYVKSGKDQGSLTRGLGAVAQGAGIGATIGSIIPGVGTVVGGAVGGLAGGAYSLFKDKNLRDFVGGKLEGGAKAVGGFFGGVGKGVSSFFGGGDDKKTQPGDLKDTGLGGIASKALGPVAFLLGKTDIGKEVIASLDKAGTKVADFFTKKIPDLFSRGVKGIENFFTKTLPGLPGKAFDAITTGFGVLLGFFIFKLPKVVAKFFTKDIPAAAKSAWQFIQHDLWDPFVAFVEAIPSFFTQTIPHWFETVAAFKYKHIDKPITDFITKKIPEFFTQTIPRWFEEAPKFFTDKVITPVSDFFTVTVPAFFTTTLPNAIKALPGFLYDNLVQPILDFFKGIAGHVGDFLKGGFDWAKSLFTRGTKNIEAGADTQKKMSGGLITGVYQGIEDTARVMATPGEFYIRRSRVQQPGAQQFLTDFNEGRIDPSQFYAGLSAASAPQVRSFVPPSAVGMAGAVPSVVNHTVNEGGLALGDITINNPVREKSEHSLRRQIQLAAIRHRR